MRPRILATLLCTLAVSAAAPALAQGKTPSNETRPPQVTPRDDVDAYIEQMLRQRHVPGASVAVVKDGQVVLARGYGLADVEHGVPATADTVYQLASVTKTFTATAVMMLAKDGEIALDDKITARLPGLPSAWDKVTVRHLLTHTSGIKSYTSVKDFDKLVRKDFTPREILDLVADAPLEFAPGEKWAYCNTGYFLLGMLIEQTCGKPYGELMAARIFRPLGMVHTRVNDLRDIIPNRARGYHWDGKALQNGEYVSPTQPFAAGALVSTVSDLVKWDAALADHTLLDAATQEEMGRPTPLGTGEAAYGYGWQLGKANGHRVIAHGGGIPGSRLTSRASWTTS